jgi:hypothetical protein
MSEIQLVVSVIKASPAAGNRDSFAVKVGLTEVGSVYRIDPKNHAYREETDHHGRWVWESAETCSLDLGSEEENASWVGGEPPGVSHSTRLKSVYAMLAYRAHGDDE